MIDPLLTPSVDMMRRRTPPRTRALGDVRPKKSRSAATPSRGGEAPKARHSPNVVRAARDPKPEAAPVRRCGCGCGLPVIPPNIYGAKGCANRGRQRQYLQKKHKPTNKGWTQHTFAGRPKKAKVELGDSWWILPMTRAAFMIEARRRHPEATS